MAKKNKNDGADQTVEQYEFGAKATRGFPELNWRGKTPFTSTRFYPAQLKEAYGVKPDQWANRLYWGDNLQVLSHLLNEFRGKIDFIYIDPPFDSKADYKKKITVKGKRISGDASAFEEKQYTDIWANDEYLQFMYERLVLLRELLSDSGVMFLHCDTKRSHMLRCLMDEVFGPDSFRNEIVRLKCNPKNSDIKAFGNIHDTVFFYAKSVEDRYPWTKQFDAISSEDIERIFPKLDDNGRRYTTVALHAPGERTGETGRPWRGVSPPPGRHWAYVHASLEEFDAQGKIEWSSNGVPRLKRYSHEKEGDLVQDIWTMKDPQYPMYPTEKPVALIERLIKATTQDDALVLDCFLGSGTTAIAAANLDRRFIGVDINIASLHTAVSRLQRRQANEDGDLVKSLLPLQIYNVNDYDIFRNPVEARELVLKALEVTRLSNSTFDGEKDGRMIKLLPLNRIASRAEISEFIQALDYKSYEKKIKLDPDKPVEKITLVCMGHEPDLKAHFQKECPYKIDLSIVDLLRDRQDLQFKRESEARIKIKGKKLIIDRFYPMNLLQKLSLQKEKVTDWRELVESVLIDWNYDGAVLEPTVIDIPGKDELVKGEYEVPQDAGTIRVKITDLLSESLEVEVERE